MPELWAVRDADLCLCTYTCLCLCVHPPSLLQAFKSIIYQPWMPLMLRGQAQHSSSCRGLNSNHNSGRQLARLLVALPLGGAMCGGVGSQPPQHCSERDSQVGREAVGLGLVAGPS